MDEYDAELSLDVGVEIDQAWNLGAWNSVSYKTGKHKDLAPLVLSVCFKLHQARYHLQRVLHYDAKVQELVFDPGKDFERSRYSVTTKYEFDSMIYALNSAKDILAKVIYSVYDLKIKKDDKIYFSKLEGCFQEIEKGDLDFAKHLKDFDCSEEGRYVTDYCNEVKHRDALISDSVIELDFEKGVYNAGVEIPDFIVEVGGKSKESRFYKKRWISDAIGLEEAHRKAICEAGRLMLKHQGYKPVPGFFVEK